MQATSEDLRRAMSSMKIDHGTRAETFLDVLGYDIDSSFRQPLEYQVVNDVSHISTGGQIVQGGANLTVNVRDEGVLLDLQKSAIAFDCVLNANILIPDNGVAFFEPTTGAVGRLSWAFSDMARCNQLLIHQRSKKRFSDRAQGMLMDLRTGGSLVLADGTESGCSAANAILASNPATQYALKKANFMYLKQVAANTYRYVIPLAEIFPTIAKTFPEGIFIGMGQHFQASAIVQQANRFLNSRIGGVVQADVQPFVLQNMHLIKVYSKLDAERSAAMLKASLAFQKIDMITQKAPYAQSINLVYNLNEKQRVKKVHIGFFWNKSAEQGTANGHTVVASNDFDKILQLDIVGNNAASSYKNPTTYFPSGPIRNLTQVTINFGGETRVFQMAQIQALAESQAISSTEHLYQDDPYLQSMHGVLCLDLQRMAGDLVGSSSGNSVSMQISLTFGANHMWTGGFYFTTTGGIGGNVPSDRIQCQSYLETGQDVFCETGIYKY